MEVPYIRRICYIGGSLVLKIRNSAVSLHPKIGNIRRFVPCGCSLYSKDSLYRGYFRNFPTSEGLHHADVRYIRRIRYIRGSLDPEICYLRLHFPYIRRLVTPEFPVSEVCVSRCSLNPELTLLVTVLLHPGYGVRLTRVSLWQCAFC